MRQRKLLDELILELGVLEKKRTEILQEASKLIEKNSDKVRPEEIQSLIGRARKLVKNFDKKVEAIEKMVSKK
ncbi:MAG TPA: hypothetical protein VMV66_03385 [Candidatus Humimicrobiaceae bacterium]|nr:hypothetical protein [Candidatus Humimicrobiaceae bacterium]